MAYLTGEVTSSWANAVSECDSHPLTQPWQYPGKGGLLSACQRVLSLEIVSELWEKSFHGSVWPSVLGEAQSWHKCSSPFPNVPGGKRLRKTS